MNRFYRHHQKGFTMIELIVALALLSFGVLAIYGAFIPISRLSFNASYRLTAAYLGQEGIEVIRNIRDNNFIQGLPFDNNLLACSLGCQADYKTGTAVETPENQLQLYDPERPLRLTPEGFYSYDNGEDSNFKRMIVIEQVSPDILNVTVTVSWDYNGITSSHTSEGYLYNWY